jgi:hypothetical protein
MLTQGPWNVRADDSWIEGWGDAYEIEAPNAPRVTGLENTPTTIGLMTSREDALRAAAAPELYEALELASGLMFPPGSAGLYADDENNKRYDDAVRKVLTALAKARGEHAK